MGAESSIIPRPTAQVNVLLTLALATNYIDAGLKTKAKAALKKLITKYPKTQAAKTAAALLDELGKQ